MVQQTKDSKCCEYNWAKTETGLPQLSVPVAVKKTVLLRENMVFLSTSGSLLPKESGPTTESVNISGVKRSSIECLKTPTQLQCPISNAMTGHLVYVRRKHETEPVRSGACDNQTDGIDCLQLRSSNNQDEVTQKKSQDKESGISNQEISPISNPSSVGFSSAKPFMSTSLEKTSVTLSPANLDHLPSNPTPGNSTQVHIEHWEERYSQLQNLLRTLDQSNQNNYIQMLRSFSSVELSKHAVELEKRSIQLSLEEGKELQRVKVLDVLEKYPKHSRESLSLQDLLQK